MADWTPDLSTSDKPRYLAIADAIADDIGAGRLAVGDRLPPQRKLAKRLDVDFTTVARGYVEAQKRGLIRCKVGQGRALPAPRPTRMPPRAGSAAARWFRRRSGSSFRRARTPRYRPSSTHSQNR